MTEATDTHSEYVILKDFPRQQGLRERTSMLAYVYTYFSNHIVLSLWSESASYIAEDPCCLQCLLLNFLCQFTLQLSVHETYLLSDSLEMSLCTDNCHYFLTGQLKAATVPSSGREAGLVYCEDFINLLYVFRFSWLMLFNCSLPASLNGSGCDVFVRTSRSVCDWVRLTRILKLPTRRKTPEDCRLRRCGLNSRNFDKEHTHLKIIRKR